MGHMLNFCYLILSRLRIDLLYMIYKLDALSNVIPYFTSSFKDFTCPRLLDVLK